MIGFWVYKAGGATVYSMTFPRGGLGCIFAASILALIGSPTLTITIEHKNHEDTTWSSLGTFTPTSGTGNITKDLSGIKEEVRFAFTVSATNDWEGLLVNMTSPSWRPYA